MRTIAVFIALLFAATASAQTPQQLNALNTAEKHWVQGNFTEVAETLTPHRSPNTDAALYTQVEAFLENQSSERAVMTALMLNDDDLRNRTVYDIMHRQLYAVSYMPGKFDMMIAKAEKTAQFLTGDLYDTGYASIASHYFHRSKSEAAWEAMKKIDAERHFAGRSDLAASIRAMSDANEKLEDAKRFRALVETIQSPQTKAAMMMSLVELYIERTDSPEPLASEFRKKRTETLDEATALVLSLPDTAYKARHLQQIRKYCYTYERTADAKALDLVILDIIENIEDAQQRFPFYAELARSGQQDADKFLEKMHAIAEQTNRTIFWRTLFDHYPNKPDDLAVLDKMEYILERMEKTLPADGFRGGNHQFVTQGWYDISLSYLRLYRPGQPDADKILEKMQACIKKIDDPFQRMVAMFMHWDHYQRHFPSAPQRREAFDQVLKVLTASDTVGGQRMTRLGWMISGADEEETDILVDAIFALFESSNLQDHETRQRRNMTEQIIRKLLQQQKMGQVQELIQSPQVPEEWKPDFVRMNVQAFLSLDSAKFEEHKEDFWKVLDLLPTPQEKFWVLDDALVPWIKLNAPEDWKKRLELASEISGPRAQFSAFAKLLSWTGTSYRGATWMNDGKEYRPMLMETMEKIAEAETDPLRKVRFYGEIIISGRQFGMWDAKKSADWQEKYDAALAQVPRAEDRYSELWRVVFAEVDVVSRNKDFRQRRLDALLAAVRDIPEHNYRDRLGAFLGTAAIAHDFCRDSLPGLAAEILEEAAVYSRTIPEQERRTREISEVLGQMVKLRDRLSR